MDLNAFMNEGITTIFKTASRFYFKSKEGLLFLSKLGPKLKSSAKLRDKYEENGLHVPPFLIASIASACNLRCAGCYARSAGSCADSVCDTDMSETQWRKVFAEASKLGVSFILLAGGEPFTRKDVLLAASESKDIIFPIFTNGTMFDDQYFDFFNRNRNMVPILSIEGEEAETDARRGAKTYDKIISAAKQLEKRGILYGASITVTKSNIEMVSDPVFVDSLRSKGCGLVIFVEYVPTEAGTENLVLSLEELSDLAERMESLRSKFKDMIVLSFPGDEEALGGCLAAGRGFFHINPSGGAEPCPFSPHSVHNLKNYSIEQILKSQFFSNLRSLTHQLNHTGGCTLFEHREQVENILNS